MFSAYPMRLQSRTRTAPATPRTFGSSRSGAVRDSNQPASATQSSSMNARISPLRLPDADVPSVPEAPSFLGEVDIADTGDLPWRVGLLDDDDLRVAARLAGIPDRCDGPREVVGRSFVQITTEVMDPSLLAGAALTPSRGRGEGVRGCLLM